MDIDDLIDLFKKSNSKYKILDIINEQFSDDEKLKILFNKDLLIETFQLDTYDITKLIKTVSNDEDKQKLSELYELSDYDYIKIVCTFSDEHKVNFLLNNNELYKYDIVNILSSMNVESLSSFFKDNKIFLIENNICPYEVISDFNSDFQKQFFNNLENCNFTLSEKREILATLNDDVKRSFDIETLPTDYRTAIDMKTHEYSNFIDLDLNKNLDDYVGLDNLLYIDPEKIPLEQKSRFMDLCEICPNMAVVNTLDKVKNEFDPTFESTVREYKSAEKWIDEILDSIDSDYSDLQKLALIDNAIGRKISYSPNFDTEVFNHNDCRALWKIIDSGYGICNGIARVEQYILDRVGIDCDIISSGRHAFLKVKNIEIPQENGEIVTGNTVLDPTWNLSNHRFGARPFNFCKSYENIRLNDVDVNGVDHFSHKNDDELTDATLNLEEQDLRKLFTSVGLADENGIFPINNLFNQSDLLHETYKENPERNIWEHFSLLSKFCPDFATCQNSSINILSEFLDNENLDFNRCVINRAYDVKDDDRNPVLYVFIDSAELGEKFYFADKDEGHFIELPKQDFKSRFECYDMDLEKNNGFRPWEHEKEEHEINLNSTSGTIHDREEEER